MMDRNWLRSISTVAMLLVAAGCDPNKTETGYSPRRVGMSNAEIRSLYAPAFSPEARPPEQDRKADVSVHRPGT
jgi:hypothetical protein